MTIRRAVKYLHNAQRPEGGWYGSWGICYTYATQFALESLALVGETYGTSERVRKACHFLLEHQKEDGGWGESYMVCHLHLTSTVPDLKVSLGLRHRTMG